MVYCQNCGCACEEGAKFCKKCGSPLNQTQDNSTQAAPQQVNVTINASDLQQSGVMSETDKTLRLIAFIFNCIIAVCCCWVVIPLAWMVPMTVISYGIYQGTRKNSVAFGVCCLLFMGIVPGVLLLCSKKDV